MKFEKHNGAGLSWPELCDFMKRAADAGGEELNNATIRARMTWGGKLQSISVDTDEKRANG
jgi:hypothetical protein